MNENFVAVHSSNPLHEFEGKWYFWDEVWQDRIGPYETKDEAKDALKIYAENL